jgi:hypothetical protein
MSAIVWEVAVELADPIGGPYVTRALSKTRKASGDVAFVIMVVSKSEWFVLSKSVNEARILFAGSAK